MISLTNHYSRVLFEQASVVFVFLPRSFVILCSQLKSHFQPGHFVGETSSSDLSAAPRATLRSGRSGSEAGEAAGLG